MKIGFNSSVYSVFARPPSIADQKFELSSSTSVKAPPMKTDGQLVDDFYKRLVQSNFTADKDEDGLVTKNEYLQSKKELAAQNERPYDPDVVERHWNKIDPSGKGSVNQEEMRSGLARLLPVSVGHLGNNDAERLRRQSGS